jgi:hypothetical protein
MIGTKRILGERQAIAMKVKFTLTMDNLNVDGRDIDTVIFDWISELEHDELLAISHNWIASQNFLTQRMTGLNSVGESSLTIEPLDDF